MVAVVQYFHQREVLALPKELGEEAATLHDRLVNATGTIYKSDLDKAELLALYKLVESNLATVYPEIRAVNLSDDFTVVHGTGAYSDTTRIDVYDCTPTPDPFSKPRLMATIFGGDFFFQDQPHRRSWSMAQVASMHKTAYAEDGNMSHLYWLDLINPKLMTVDNGVSEFVATAVSGNWYDFGTDLSQDRIVPHKGPERKGFPRLVHIFVSPKESTPVTAF